MEPVSSLFLHQLGVNGAYGAEDAKKLCRVMIDMYDMNRHLKEAVHNIKGKVGKVNRTPRAVMSGTENDNTMFIDDRSVKTEVAKLRGEMKDLVSENEELKKMLFGVDCVQMSFKDCCAELFGPQCKSVSSLTELRNLLHSLKAQDGRSNHGHQSESELDISDAVKLQKEVPFIDVIAMTLNIPSF